MQFVPKVLVSSSLVFGQVATISPAHADILAAIAQCESHGHQFDADGNVLRNPNNRKWVGILQIDEKLHAAKARRLGLNIYTLEGNLAFGRYLLQRDGTAPWGASRHCWRRMAGR